MLTSARTTRPFNPPRQEQSYASSSTTMASNLGRQSAIGRLRFWLPIALIVSAVWVSHADRRYATITSDTAAEPVDLVEEVSGSNIWRQLLFPALGVTGLLLWRSNRKPIRLRPLLAASAIVLLVFVGASVLWSVEPSRSLKRASVVYFIAMAAIGIGRTWTARDLCRAALVISSLFVGVSILFELQAGSFLGGPGYRFSGAFHPNQQAVNTSVLALSSLCLFRDSGKYRYLAVAVLGIALTKLTGSRGCIFGLIFAVASMCWVTMSRSQRLASMIACGVCFSIGLILLAASSDPVPGLSDVARLGRVDQGDQGEILNGRLAIWHELIGDITERPLIGYGYGAFWTSDRVFEYSWIHDWAFSSAHSVWLETALDIGIVGAIVFVAVVMIAWMTSLRIFSQNRDWGVMFIFSLICMGMISGLVDVMFVRIGFVTILLAIGVAVMSMYPLGLSATATRMGHTRNPSHTQHGKVLVCRVGQGDFRRGRL